MGLTLTVARGASSRLRLSCCASVFWARRLTCAQGGKGGYFFWRDRKCGSKCGGQCGGQCGSIWRGVPPPLLFGGGELLPQGRCGQNSAPSPERAALWPWVHTLSLAGLPATFSKHGSPLPHLARLPSATPHTAPCRCPTVFLLFFFFSFLFHFGSGLSPSHCRQTRPGQWAPTQCTCRGAQQTWFERELRPRPCALSFTAPLRRGCRFHNRSTAAAPPWRSGTAGGPQPRTACAPSLSPSLPTQQAPLAPQAANPKSQTAVPRRRRPSRPTLHGAPRSNPKAKLPLARPLAALSLVKLLGLAVWVVQLELGVQVVQLAVAAEEEAAGWGWGVATVGGCGAARWVGGWVGG